MTKALSLKATPPGRIVLDSDTARFFSAKYHSGPLENFFHLDCPSVRPRVFAGRVAQMYTGERVVVLQQQKTAHSGPTVDEGAVFVGDATLLHYFESFPAAPRIVRFWKRELFGGQRASAFLLRAHPLPSYRGRVARCYMPQQWGLGNLIWEANQGTLIDLRSTDKAHRVTLKPGDTHEMRFALDCPRQEVTRIVSPTMKVQRERPPLRVLIDKSRRAFLAGCYNRELDRENNLYHLLKFFSLSEEERCIRALGCDLATMGRAMERFRHLLFEHLLAQGVGETSELLIWRPWLKSQSLLGQPFPHDSRRAIPLPEDLKRDRAEVFAELACHPVEYTRNMSRADYRAARIEWEWARQFPIQVTRPISAHDFSMITSLLDEHVPEQREFSCT